MHQHVAVQPMAPCEAGRDLSGGPEGGERAAGRRTSEGECDEVHGRVASTAPRPVSSVRAAYHGPPPARPEPNRQTGLTLDSGRGPMGQATASGVGGRQKKGRTEEETGWEREKGVDSGGLGLSVVQACDGPGQMAVASWLARRLARRKLEDLGLTNADCWC